MDDKVLDIIAYYLSEYDVRAFHELGHETQSEGFRKIGERFQKKDSYLRRLRDEYDVLTSNHRNGQRNRPPRKRIINTCQYLSGFTFEELTDMVRAFIESGTGYVTSDSPEAEIQDDSSLPEMTEEQIESIINFKDAGTDVVVTGSSRRRVYNTTIIRQLKRLYRGQCQLCGCRPLDEYNADITEVHHISYFSDSLNNDSSNLIVLCPNHHRLIHKMNLVFDRDNMAFITDDGQQIKVLLNLHLS